MSKLPLPAPLSRGYFSPVRTLLASALLALACGCADRSSRPSGAGAPPSIPGGPDPVVLRVAHDGGVMSAYPYPKLDSVLWKSGTRVPALQQVVAFGPEDGYLAAVDRRGSTVRIDLRLGSVSSQKDSALRAVSSAEGDAIFGINSAGAITRFTASGSDWSYTPKFPASALFAQSDGSLIAAGAQGKKVVVWRVRPPNQDVVDTLSIDVGGDAKANAAMIAATAGSVGDRVYFGAHESVIAVRSRDAKLALNLNLGDPIKSIAATPSGDRLFVALDDDRSLRVVDRFEEKVSDKIKLPAVATELRMDALGRVLLARGPHDSTFVVSLASDDVQGTVRGAWRADLPLVLPDGMLALARGADVVLAHPSTLADTRTLAGAANDFWFGLRWNGFRPRSAGLDQPVQFRTSAPRDSADLADSLRPPRDSGAAPPATRGDSGATGAMFTVAFASVQSEKQARDLASRIKVGGQSPRITTSERNGTMLYRVVMGPYPSRDEADRIGRASGQSYWIFEGVP